MADIKHMLFEDMNRSQKIDHIEKCMAEALPEVREVTYMAEILDVWDYWFPWMIEELRKTKV
jgi:hypothetical protein